MSASSLMVFISCQVFGVRVRADQERRLVAPREVSQFPFDLPPASLPLVRDDR